MITLDNISKTYETNAGPLLALDRFAATIDEGQFVSVVGPSGCGKTTLLKMIAGLLLPTMGRVLVADAEITGPRPDVGIVFQGAVLLPWRTALANTLLPIELRERPNEHHENRARELLSSVGLDGFEERYPHELSGGMQQRVALCRALVHDPRILLLDEPFGALDALTREQLNVQLNRLWNETRKTALLITHNIAEALFLSQRVIVMGPRPGHILEVLEVGFPPERGLEIMGLPEFASLGSQIRRHFDSERSTSG